MQARAAITVNEDPPRVYARWRDITKFPTFMTHIRSVSPIDEHRSHWTADLPTGPVEWDCNITEDVPDQRIGWTSAAGAPVHHGGSVDFRRAPGGRGTEVHATVTFEQEPGPVGSMANKLFGDDPGQQLHDQLRRFKQLVETGEIARTGGAPMLAAGSTVSPEEVRQRAMQMVQRFQKARPRRSATDRTSDRTSDSNSEKGVRA